jgi:S1-C subfamily serine protease
VDLYETGNRGARFRFEVPNNAQTLDVRVLGASRDVDLFLRKGSVITSHTDESGYDIQSVTTRLNERIELARSSTPALTPGVWYLDVASLVGSDERIAFDLVVAVDSEVEGDRIDFPPYFRTTDLTPLERAGQAIVQVASESGSGSGTVLSADGYLMTNHHVIEEDGVVQQDDIFISFITDFDEPPSQIFVAEVVEFDAELDLALLKITRDIYDRPLSANLHLPYMELGDPNAMRHGDMLYIAGYPSVGGFESRSSLSVTRGIVSGFINDVDGEREWIKTDARINAGNSGGTAMDLNFRYVGVPSRERIAEDDELGYSRPVNTIPDAWKRLFQSTR